MFAKWLPWLLFGLLAGALLDRWDRRDVDARMADFARRSGLPAERAARLAAPQRAGRWRVAIALAGLTALAIAAVAFSPAVLAPERPGAAAFAVQPMVGGKVRARLDGSLDGPEVRRELARALQQHGINVKFLLIPGLERLAGRVLSKDHTRPLSEFTYDRAQLEPGAEQVPGVVNVTVYIAVGVTQQP